MHRQIGQVPLPDFAASAQQLEQRVLRGAEPDTAQLLVVEPTDGSRCLTQGAAQAWTGGQSVVLGAHVRCICSELAIVKGAIRS